jgi:hypothetical protein
VKEGGGADARGRQVSWLCQLTMKEGADALGEAAIVAVPAYGEGGGSCRQREAAIVAVSLIYK